VGHVSKQQHENILDQLTRRAIIEHEEVDVQEDELEEEDDDDVEEAPGGASSDDEMEDEAA
jgi:hypothetical protein